MISRSACNVAVKILRKPAAIENPGDYSITKEMILEYEHIKSVHIHLKMIVKKNTLVQYYLHLYTLSNTTL